MKLRNKKTGEIIQLSVKCENGGELRTFDLNTNTDKPITLAELNEGWEDYEEPKEYWFIDYDGGIIPFDRRKETATDRLMKSIGNYFETREKAEKAVEKLKAWKRLTDKGFRFNGWNGTQIGSNIAYISEIYYEGCADDMDLLFGGEE